MPSDWYAVLDGKSCGPFDDSRIKALAHEGKITPDTLVSRAGMKQWVQARQIKGLFPAGQASARPSPAPGVANRATALPRRVQPVEAPVSEQGQFPIPTTGTRPARGRYAAKQDCTVNMLLGLGGAGALLLGFFCPILRLPIIGSMSYLSFVGLLVREGAASEMTISAFLVLAAVVLALLVAILQHPTWFWIPGIAGVAAALVTLGKFFWLQG
jgi:hypothetical protein